MASQRQTVCRLHTANHRTGLRYFPYATILLTGLYTEDGQVLRGTEREAKSSHDPIPAPATAVPKNCCGQLAIT